MLTDEDLSQISGDVWSAVLGLQLKLLGEVPEFDADAPMVTAMIQITGEWLWTVRLDCSRALARAAAALMFDQEPEEVSDDDVNDAFGEIANMTGGNVKNLVVGPSRLALPTVTGGVGFRVVIPGARVHNRVGFICSGQPLVVSLLQQSDRQANSALAAGDAETIPLSYRAPRRLEPIPSRPAEGEQLMKILVVDDSKAMRMIVIRSLKSTGYGSASILEATNGSEALGMIRAEQPDVVLCDWNMPEMNGIELLEALGAEGMAVKFGFVTSESTPEMRERAAAAGALFLVSKPFTPESLERALAKVM